jgi:hypothetical protein
VVRLNIPMVYSKLKLKNNYNKSEAQINYSKGRKQGEI